MNSLLVNLGLQFIIYQYNLVKWRKQDKMSCFLHFFLQNVTYLSQLFLTDAQNL